MRGGEGGRGAEVPFYKDSRGADSCTIHPLCILTDNHLTLTHLNEFVAGNPVGGLALSVDELKRHFLARCVGRAHRDVEA